MGGQRRSLLNQQKMLTQKRMKKSTRKFKKARKHRKTKRSQRGGLGQAWRLPEHAVVIWRNLQDKDLAPFVSTYGEVREELGLTS